MTKGFKGRTWLMCPAGAMALGATGNAPLSYMGSASIPASDRGCLCKTNRSAERQGFIED